MRKLFAPVFCLILSLSVFAENPRQINPRDEVSKLRFAAGQHEIVTVLIQDKKFSSVLPEFRKILQLDLQGENETLVVQSAWAIVEQLRETKQFSIAHQILDETLTQTEGRQNKFSLLMLKGKTFKDEGRLQEAIETYRKAQALQD